MKSSVSVTWTSREPPRTPVGAAAFGAAGARLAERLRVDRGAVAASSGAPDLVGLVSDVVTIVLGPFERLPWCEGIVYVGHDADCPQLLLPVHAELNLPAVVLWQALTRRALPPPFLLRPDPPGILALGALQPIGPQLAAPLPGARRVLAETGP